MSGHASGAEAEDSLLRVAVTARTGLGLIKDVVRLLTNADVGKAAYLLASAVLKHLRHRRNHCHVLDLINLKCVYLN